jgi:hypothetical protein
MDFVLRRIGIQSTGYAWVPNGNGYFFTNPGNGGGLQVTFEVPVSAEYIIWGRIMANNGNDDSICASVDDSEAVVWHTRQGGVETWTWDVVSIRQAGEEVLDTSHPNAYWLEAGTHSIEFSQREDGTKLDRILITNDLQYIPGI